MLAGFGVAVCYEVKGLCLVVLQITVTSDDGKSCSDNACYCLLLHDNLLLYDTLDTVT